MRYAIYTENGKIDRVVDCPECNSCNQTDTGEFIVPFPDGRDNTYYIVDGVPTARGVMPAATDKTKVQIGDPVNISSIPVGAILVVEENSYIISDGVAELTFDATGTYQVTLSCFPYLDTIFYIEVV